MGKLIPPVVVAGALSRTPQPTLRIDDELTLRPWSADDAAAVVEAYRSPEIQRYHFRHYETEDEALAWIVGANEGWTTERSANWAVVGVDDDVVRGRVSIYLHLEDGHGEVAYWVLPWARGLGVATRACRRATAWAHEIGLHRVQLEHSTENVASRKVALRSGFIHEGTRRGANLHDDGWHDMVLYGHIAGDSGGDRLNESASG